MITFEQGNARFNYRVVGVMLHKGHVLLQRAESDNFWCLPGGRVELLEPSKDALMREMREELGAEPRVERLVWLVENFFDHDGVSCHELSLYYLMTFPEDSYLYSKAGPFERSEEGCKLIFKWHRLDELDRATLYPAFLRKSLGSIPESTEHIVHIDGKPHP